MALESDDEHVNIGEDHECHPGCDGTKHRIKNSQHDDAAFPYFDSNQENSTSRLNGGARPKEHGVSSYPDQLPEQLNGFVKAKSANFSSSNVDKNDRYKRAQLKREAKQKKDQKGWVKAQDIEGHKKEAGADDVNNVLEYITGESVVTDTLTDSGGGSGSKLAKKSRSSRSNRRSEQQRQTDTRSSSSSAQDVEDEKKLEESEYILEQTVNTLQTIQSMTMDKTLVDSKAKSDLPDSSFPQWSSEEIDDIDESEFTAVSHKKRTHKQAAESKRLSSNTAANSGGSNGGRAVDSYRHKTNMSLTQGRSASGSSSSATAGSNRPNNTNNSSNIKISKPQPPAVAPSFDLYTFPALESNSRPIRRTSLGDIKMPIASESAPVTDDERDSVKSQPNQASVTMTAGSTTKHSGRSWANIAADPQHSKTPNMQYPKDGSRLGPSQQDNQDTAGIVTTQVMSRHVNAIETAKSIPYAGNPLPTVTSANDLRNHVPSTISDNREPPISVCSMTMSASHKGVSTSEHGEHSQRTEPPRQHSTSLTSVEGRGNNLQVSPLGQTSAAQPSQSTAADSSPTSHVSGPSSGSLHQKGAFTASTDSMNRAVPRQMPVLSNGPSIEFGTVTTGADVTSNREVRDILLQTSKQPVVPNPSSGRVVSKSHSYSNTISLPKSASISNAATKKGSRAVRFSHHLGQSHGYPHITFGYCEGDDAISTPKSTDVMTMSCPAVLSSMMAYTPDVTSHPVKEARATSVPNVDKSGCKPGAANASVSIYGKSTKKAHWDSGTGGFDYRCLVSLLNDAWNSVKTRMESHDESIIYLRGN